MAFKLNLRFSQKVLVLLCVPVLFQIVFVALLATNLKGLEDCYKREAVVADLMSDVNRFMMLLMNCAGAQAMYQMNRDVGDKARFDKMLESMEVQSLSLFEKLSVHKLTKTEAVMFSEICAALRTGIVKANKAMTSQDRVDMMVAFMEMRKMTSKVNNWSQKVSVQLDDERKAAALDQIRIKNQVMAIIFGGIAIDIVLVLIMVAIFDRSTGRRFSDLMSNIVALGVDKPLEKKVEGNDDFARLDGVLHKVAAAVRDLRKTEQAIIENAADVICSLDRNGRFLQVNPAAEILWKRNREDLIGQSLVSLVAENDRERTHALIEKAIESQANAKFELQMIDRDGTSVEMLWNAFWSTDMERLFCVAHNITERKQLERMKQEFVAMISHDVRSPLTSLQLTLGVLSSGKLGEMPESAQSRLQRAESSVEHIIQLVGDLLEMEKLDSGVFVLEKRQISGDKIIGQSVSLVDEALHKSDIKVKVVASAEEVFCDEPRMVRVITNLLSNAIKFSAPNSEILVSFSTDGKTARFDVSDSGRGIPKEKQDLVFERYRQLESADEHEKKGSGLGLAICKAIVEAHGGTIGVNSELGKGSNFWLTVPCT